MSALTIWKFNSPTGADVAEETVLDLQKKGLIEVEDAATVSWPSTKKKPKTRQLNRLAGLGALDGAFWGLLFGLIFFVPFLGAAVGAAAGGLGGSMVDIGIDDDLIKKVRDEIIPGTSALFLMSNNAVLDKVHDAFDGLEATLVSTNLSNEQETKLRELFHA
jgi:uncharacterized membrane protein